VELRGQAESRGYLLEDSLTLVGTVHWLQMIDWQTKFLSMVLNTHRTPRPRSRSLSLKVDRTKPKLYTGMLNTGHTFGDDLTEEQRLAVLEFLKCL
jgi:hypothetical protein